MRIAALLTVLASSAFLAACGGGGGGSAQSAEPAPPPPATETTPPVAQPPPPPAAPKFVKGPVFTKADLKRIALRPVDVPAGLAYDRTQSGPGSLEQLLVVPRRIRAVRERGFRGLYTVVYNSKSSSEDRVLGERIWLFRTPRGASAFLADSLQEAIGLQAATIDAPDLGNESWAIRALVQVATGEIITHGFRIGNSVFIVNIYGQATPVTQAEALRAAKKALARAAPA